MVNPNKNPDSKRSKKRAARNFTMSRPNRRAQRRLNSALGAYVPSDVSCKKPGALKRW